MAQVRRFGTEDFAVLEDGEAHLVAFEENAVYGLELAFPESDDDSYRVDLTRTTREASGMERRQRLPLHEYNSHMEAEEGYREAADRLFEQGRDAIAEYLSQLEAQPAEYTVGLMIASYPPDAIFTGEEASVSLIAVTENGVQDAMVGWNLPPHEASHLSMTLEEAQEAGGIPLLIEMALEEAQTRGQLEAGQPLFAPVGSAYLDQRSELERDAEIVQQSDAWGWHEARFAVLPDEDGHQVALLDVYHDALTGDLAGSYLPMGSHDTLSDAEAARDELETAAFESSDDSSGWAKFAETQIENPQWQPMQPEHYRLYDELKGGSLSEDMPSDDQLDPMLVEAMRLGAVVVDMDRKEQGMSNTLKAERLAWEVDLNEHVTHLPPHVTAEYRSLQDAEGIAPVRLRLDGDESMYGFEVSAPDEQGDVTLAAIKTFESEILQKDVTETAVLKTYQAGDYADDTSYLNPRTEALSDARALVYEWGRQDLDHSMGSALLLAQENGFKGDSLFTEGPADTFTIPDDARSVATIQAERDGEREQEMDQVWDTRPPDRRLGTPLGVYVDRYAEDYIETDGALVAGYDGQNHRVIGRAELPTDITDQAPSDDIRYFVLPTDAVEASEHPAEYDPVRMKPVEDGIPADHGTDYAFEVSHMRLVDGGELKDSYHLVEAVKTWHDPDLLPDEPDTRLTLSLPLAAYDDKEAAFETAHRLTAKWWAEGIQPAMQDAAGMAEQHLDPRIMDVKGGHLFGMGPTDPFTVDFKGREVQAPDFPDDEDTVILTPPPVSQDYHRTIGEAAYDLPLEEGQAYGFQARRVEELEDRVAAYGVDALAVEAVKHWNDGEPQQEVVTLGIYYDRDEARQEVDTYVDLAEREGIQTAMTRAAMIADIQLYPNMVEEADELGLHINEDVRYGDMFKRGPDDPFLSEREINFASQQYAADHPPHHKLSLEVVPVQAKTGQALGHSVLAIDAAWDYEETSRDLSDAQGVTVYELAQFESKEKADLYSLSLSEYMGKRELEPEGQDIGGAVDFVKGISQSNGHDERWLAPWDIAELAKGEWSLQHQPEDFKPMTVDAPALVVPDMDI